MLSRQEVPMTATTVRKPGKAENRVRMGDALAALGRKAGLKDDDIAALARSRERAPAEPVRFRSKRPGST